METDKSLWRADLESVLVGDAFDLWDWKRAMQVAPQLDVLNRRAAQDFNGNPGQDAFLSVFQDSPVLEHDVEPGLRPLSAIMARAMDTPEWHSMHESARGDLLASALSAKGIVDGVFSSLPDDVTDAAREAREAAQDLDNQQQRASEAREDANWLRDALSGYDELDDGAQDKLRELDDLARASEAVVEKHLERLNEALEAFDEVAERNDARIRALVNDKAAEARQQADDEARFIRAYTEAAGGDPSQVDTSMSELAMRALRNNPNLQGLADALGWARRVTNAAVRMSPHGGVEFSGVTAGGFEPSKMLGQELVALSGSSEDNPLFWDAARRGLDNGLLLREHKGEDEQGKGPMIIVRDESGSMSGPAHAMAVAVEWALMDVARKEGREFFSVAFSGKGQFEVWQAPDRPDPDGLLAHLSHFYGGGTEPYGPVRKALEIIEESGLKADVLVLTDGCFSTPPESFLETVNDLKADVPIRIEVVMVGGSGERVQDWADQVHQVSSLINGQEKLAEAIGGIVS